MLVHELEGELAQRDELIRILKLEANKRGQFIV